MNQAVRVDTTYCPIECPCVTTYENCGADPHDPAERILGMHVGSCCEGGGFNIQLTFAQARKLMYKLEEALAHLADWKRAAEATKVQSAAAADPGAASGSFQRTKPREGCPEPAPVAGEGTGGE